MTKDKKFSKWLSRGINILLLGMLGKFAWETYQRHERNNGLIGYQLHDIQVMDIRGQPRALMQDSLAPRVLIFWASWCGPCELQLARIRDAMADGTLTSADSLAAISIDDDFSAALAAAEKRKYGFPIYWDQGNVLAAKLQITAVPTFIYIDSHQAIIDIETGLSPMLITNIKKHLEKNPI